MTVAVDRLERWHRPGLLCIGDAAHAMSPIGGVGINLAVQDAVAAANILWQPLADGRSAKAICDARAAAARVADPRHPAHAGARAEQGHRPRARRPARSCAPPLPLRLASRFPLLRRIPARLVGMGVRPEHVHTPDRRGLPTSG